MKIARALQRADEGQSDCYWHDNSVSMRYLIILQGAAVQEVPEAAAVAMAQSEGRVNKLTKEYFHVAKCEPGLLPGAIGPLTILLVL
jgi:hypothetical protein